jgi:hypothetical protein
MQIKIYDEQFPHAHTMANGGLEIKSKYFEWSRTLQDSNFAFITESWFNRVHLITEKVKIGMLIEPRGFVPQWYHWIKHNYNLFDYVLTHDSQLLSLSPKFVFYPYGGSWLYANEQKVYPKTKDVSIVASSKADLEGHKLRHEVIRNIKGIDVYGNGYNRIDSVLQAYRDYKFTIVIENDKYDYWVTEKIVNPLLCGCIPIYWGCPSISRFFKDIIQFNGVSDLSTLLTSMNLDVEYEKRFDNVLSNFEEAKKYQIAEDWIWENIIKELK